MAQIVDPYTHRPVNELDHDIESLLRILQFMRVRLDGIDVQLVQLGLYIEYIVNKLTSTDDNTGPLIEIDPKEFEQFATERWEEIKEQAEEMKRKQESRTNLSPNTRINLDE